MHQNASKMHQKHEVNSIPLARGTTSGLGMAGRSHPHPIPKSWGGYISQAYAAYAYYELCGIFANPYDPLTLIPLWGVLLQFCLIP